MRVKPISNPNIYIFPILTIYVYTKKDAMEYNLNCKPKFSTQQRKL